MKMMKKVLMMALAAGGLGAACAATTVSATTPEFRLSIKHDGVRASAGEESLRYSNLWDGNADATVTISQDGTPLAEGLTGEGEQHWSVTRNGSYALTHTTYTNGIVAKVENATFVVTGKDVPVGELTIDWGESTFVYDGTPKCPVVTVKSGADTLTKDADYAVSYLDNVNVGTARVIVDGLDLYVGSRTNTFTIIKASMGGGGEGGGTGGEEPGSGTVPAGGLSKFDTSFVYDGKGHTIATNELVAAFAARLGAEPFAVAYVQGVDGGAGVPALPEEPVWSAVAPAFSAVGEYVVWYRVTSANYEDFVHMAKVTITPATIGLVADGATGEYCGLGYGITVNVSKPASGYTVKYAESAEGPWLDALEYVDVCTAKPIYYQVTATGYAPATGSANVTITPKELTEDIIWLVFPPEDYVYDGTAKEPDVAAYDGDPSIITDDDWEVSFTDNVNAGTATATFTGKGNYTGTCTEEFEIAKADNVWTTEPAVADWTYGQTPSTPVSAAAMGTATVTWSSGERPTLPGSYTATFTVPESDNYNVLAKTVPVTVHPATIQLVADGATGEYCGLGYGITVNVSKPASGYTVKYAESAEGPWVDELGYVDVCADKPIYYQVTATGYTTATGSANVTITPKELTEDIIWLVFPPEDYVYDGTAKEPDVAAYDGDPSIITDDDWEVSFEDNVNAGTATATFTGKGNYTGACTEEFEILKADNAWTTEPAVADWTYGQTPSTPVSAAAVGTATVTWSSGERPTLPGSYTATFTVPESDNYNVLARTVPFTVHPATIQLVADGATGEYCGLGYGITVNVSKPASGYTVKYAESTEGPWFDALQYVDVCTDKPIYYQVTATGYTTATGSANVTITPKELTEDIIWLVFPPEDYVYDGTAKEPEIAAYDGDPSIITDDDWEVSFTDNVNAGTATATFTGKGNYTGTCTEEFEIRPRAVTLTSADGSWTYDGAAHAKQFVSVTDGSFLDGEGVTTNGFATITNVGETPNTFSYAFIEGTKPENYEVSCETGTLVVRKAALSPDADPDPVDPSVDPEDPDAIVDPAVRFSVFDYVGVYDGTAHTIDTNALVQAYADLFLGNEPVFSYALTSNGLYQAEAFAFTDVVATSFWYKVSAGNFDEVVHPCKVVITNRPVTVSVVGHSASHTYDTTEKSVSGYEITTGDALYDVETMTSFSGTAAVARTDVGTTPMGLAAAQFANGDSNFDVTYEITDGGVTIAPCVIGGDPVKWDIRLDKAPMYDGTEQTAPIIQVCYVKPDGNLDNIPYDLAGHTATDAGNYVVTITGKGNYTGSVEKDWAIMPRNVKLTSGSAVWEYDGATHAETAVSVTGDGFIGEEGATYANFPEITHVADAAEAVPNTFSYALKPNTKAQNYEITTANGTVKMTPLAVTVTSANKTKAYDGTALKLTAADIAVGGEAGVLALPAGEAFTYGNFAERTEAGQTSATFSIADGTALLSDYVITPVYGTLTVQKSATEIAVTAKSGSWTYDGAAHQLHEYEATNLSTLLAGDALEVAFDEASVVTTPIDGPEQNGVVANTIISVRVLRNGTDDVTANYTLATYPGALTVTKRPVTLTSKSDSKAYDGTALTAHEVTVGGDGFVGEDGATYSFTGTQTEKGSSANTFTYALNEGTEAAFYAITTENGTLEVTAADITDATDADWQVVLGPALTYTGLAQVQTIASATFKGLALDYSVTGNQQTDAGSYEMTVTGQGNFSGTHTVAWSIAPKALTLTAGSGSKVYDGAALMVGTVTADGFVAGEGATYTCDGSQTDVGSSANAVAMITWNANTKGSNYAVTKVPGTLMVTPRPVTVTSRDISKPYDGTPLALTAADIVVGGEAGVLALPAGESFVYGDFAERTEAGQTSATFTIAAGAGTDLANYTITPVYGTITITKSATEIGVTAASESWVYDGEAHSNRTYTATNLSTLQAGDELEVTFDEASVVMTPTEGPASDGKVPNVITSVRVIRNGADDVTSNYTVAAYPGVLTVTKRPVTVTVVGHVATNTYDAVEHTVSGYEIATEDELYDIAAKTSFGGTDEVKRTDVGKSEMGLKPLDFTNSDDNFEVTYAVTDGWVSVVSADISAGEAADFVLTLGANPTYNGTVQTIPVTAVTYKGLPVTYTLAGENATHAGAYTLTVKANGNFAGEKSTTWQILKRQVTLTSGSASRVYDATPLQNAAVSVSGDGFIGLEGATYAVTGAQIDVGSSKNAFTYTLKAGTLAGDYEIATVQGDLSVTPRAVTLLSASASKVYDATPLVKDAVSVKPGSLGFAGSEGFAATCSGTITAVGTTPNAFTYTLANGAKAGNYAITTEYGTLAVMKATLDAGSVFPGLGTATEEEGILCERVYNGKAQPFEVEVSADFAEEYEFLYALTPGAWSPVVPTRKDVSEGSLKVFFRFLSPNFEPYEGYGTLRIVEKEITDEMVQPGEDAFFFDGDAKKPTVDVIYEVDGQDICKESDYDLVYGEKAAAGWWVTVTGKGNYSGTVTKIVPVLKRPVAPPIVPSRAYNGKTQKPTIPTDSRWTVVANPGGIDVGEYTNVVLRLTDTANYKWKGGTEEATDITLVFRVTKANNNWSQYPDMKGWAYGETPSEPAMGRARYGTVQVAYRKADADVSTETATRPELPGQYIARFYVEALANYIGVSRDVAFEITGTAPGGDHTTTTPVPVPYVWLDAYLTQFGGEYETAGHATGLNGVALWESYVAGLDPTDPTSQFTASITMDANGEPVVTWSPDLSKDALPRAYTILGKPNLGAKTEWTPVTDTNRAQMKFFKVSVELR